MLLIILNIMFICDSLSYSSYKITKGGVASFKLKSRIDQPGALSVEVNLIELVLIIIMNCYNVNFHP